MKKGLTREQAKGTLTFYLPLERDDVTPPEVTILVRRVAADQWHAGIAVCSEGDTFQKRLGRQIAFGRLVGSPIKGTTPSALITTLWERLDTLADNRPGTLGLRTVEGLDDLDTRISEMRIE